jgi:hypothetical protein
VLVFSGAGTTQTTNGSIQGLRVALREKAKPYFLALSAGRARSG